ncbi:LysR substrate-binding domain-containing protein [Xanthomonas axonopodis]|uniref:LysR substrate-binding domain-containing protein n=1 Tax=Xanthomonas axonopodis TaxID=53413 RepID=UPI0035564607
MELRHLRYFSAVAELLSFTRAAERLHVTQPTLSHQIRQLEGELNVQLFERVGRQVRLTEAGEIFRAHTAPALAQIDVGVKALRNGEPSPVRQLRIGAIPSFHMRILPRCVSQFLRTQPDHEVIVEELLLDGIVTGLIEDRLDLAISYLPPHDTRLWFEPLYQEELRLVVGRNHPFARRRHVRMAELHQVRMAVLPLSLKTRQLTDEALKMAGAQPIFVAQANTAPSVIELVRATDLVTILAESALKPDDDLCVLPLHDPTPIRTPGLMWKRGAMRVRAVRLFADIVRAVVKERV